jgi:hypothetical protein
LLVESALGVRDVPLEESILASGWEQAAVAARDHRVTPALARRISTAPNAPSSWIAALDVHRHAQLMRHMQASADLAVLSAAFAGADIHWVVGKGPVAADLIWPSPDMREYFDVDVFIGRHDFARAIDLLLDVGYELVDRNWPELLHTMRAEIALRGPAGSHLDLHWNIAVVPELRRAFRVDMTAMLERAVPARLGSGVQVHVFDQVDTVFHLAFHAAQAGANRLMWIADIHHAADSERFDWLELAARARSARTDVPLAMVLARVHRTLGFRNEPPALLLTPADGTWGRLAAGRESRSPFPDLPGDKRRGGLLYSSARPTLRGTVRRATASGWARWRTERDVERHGPIERSLHRNVPDTRAREEYFAAIRGVTA